MSDTTTTATAAPETSAGASANAPPTDLLCLRDAELGEVEATVVAIEAEVPAVALDRTVFYPGGGGQPADSGRLCRIGAENGLCWEVVGIRAERGVAWHLLAPGSTPPVAGERLRVEVDWERRHRLMRTHTALHVLCGVVFRDYGALVTGGNMGPDRARMDFEMASADFTPERVTEIERRANEEIATDRAIRVAVLPREEAFRIPDLIRTKINLLPAGIAEVRTVEIVGLDLQADGGTHVRSTGEVGGLRVVGTRSKGKANKRLEIELTDRPLEPDR